MVGDPSDREAELMKLLGREEAFINYMLREALQRRENTITGVELQQQAVILANSRTFEIKVKLKIVAEDIG